MKGGITISVVIPVYNVSACIERCILSVMNQTYTDFECILVDDCGTDDSMAKCERMIAEYHGAIRFRILHHQQNRGLSAARNTGTEAATGDYILYIDSDDAITNDCIELLLGAVEESPCVELVQGGSNRTLNRNGYARTNDEVRASFYRGQLAVFAWNKLISRDFIMRYQLFFREGTLYEDMHWMFYVVKHLSKVTFCDAVTYHHYMRPESISMGTDQHVAAIHHLNVLQDILLHLTPGKEKGELNYYSKLICRLYFKNRHDVKEYDDLFNTFLIHSRTHHCTPWLLVSATYIVAHIPYCWTIFSLRRFILRMWYLGRDNG